MHPPRDRTRTEQAEVVGVHRQECHGRADLAGHCRRRRGSDVGGPAGLAGRAEAPEGHFGLVDHEPVRGGRVQAGRARRPRSRRRRSRRSPGRPRGGGCRRPAPRSGPGCRPARSAGTARPGTARRARRRRPGWRPSRGASRTRRAISSTSRWPPSASTSSTASRGRVTRRPCRPQQLLARTWANDSTPDPHRQPSPAPGGHRHSQARSGVRPRG